MNIILKIPSGHGPAEAAALKAELERLRQIKYDHGVRRRPYVTILEPKDKRFWRGYKRRDLLFAARLSWGSKPDSKKPSAFVAFYGDGWSVGFETFRRFNKRYPTWLEGVRSLAKCLGWMAKGDYPCLKIEIH